MREDLEKNPQRIKDIYGGSRCRDVDLYADLPP
jgi:hypothetical protein